MTGATTAGPGPFEDDLGWGLGVLFRAYLKAVERAVEGIPGGPRGYQVLTAAVREPARNQGAIAAEHGIDRTVLTYLIDDLERRGLVVRRPDPADRRSRLVCATEEGRALWRQRRRAIDHIESHLLAPLDPAEAAMFRALLRRVAAAAHVLDPVTDLCQVVDEVRSGDGTDVSGARPPAPPG